MSITYVVREGFAGFGRAKLAAVGSILTMLVALLLLGGFRLVSEIASRAVSGIRERVDMEAFLVEPVSSQKVEQIRKAISEIEGIDSCQIVTKEEAARIFRQDFGEDISSVLDFNPLPPSVKIFLKRDYRTSDRAREISAAVKAVSGVDDVLYRQDMLSYIESGARTLDRIGLILGIVLAISSVFITSNTIRLTIAAQRKAIRTMKLVGASRWLVRGPFIVEGIVQGLVAGGCAAVIYYAILDFVTGLVSGDLVALFRMDYTFYAGLIALGILLGAFGSMISVRRFIGENV